MKKSIVLSIILTLTCSFLASCGTNHVHQFGEWTTVKEPSCTEEGQRERVCSCGEKQTQSISSTGHSIAAIAEVKATCTTEGKTAGSYCTKCGEQIEIPQVIPPTHLYDDGTITKEPSCFEEGIRQYTCSICGTVENQPIPKTSHTYNEGVVTTEPTCTQGGTKTYTCSVCGDKKTEALTPLGHDLDNYVCKRCGEKLPVTLNMSSSERLNALKVDYISQRQIFHDDEKNEFRLQFSFLDSDKEELITAAAVDISIINDNNETVYSAVKTIDSDDFGTWTKTLTGAKYNLATIYIKDSEITPGSSAKGTINFTVYNSGYFSFDESSLSMYDLPVKEISLELPALPKTVSYRGYAGTVYSSCVVTRITYEVSDNDLELYFTLEKTYDKEGPNHSGSCNIRWKLIDEEGYVVKTGIFFSDDLKVGEKIKSSEESVYNCIEPGGSYRLELYDYD